MIDGEARQIIERFPLGFVATVTAEGLPRVSPKGTFVITGPAEVSFAHIRSPGTLANLAQRPEVEVNFFDPFLRKAVRLRGTASVAEKGSGGFGALIGTFEDLHPTLAARIRALVRIAVSDLSLVTTPPYDDGVTEAEMIALYKAKFAGFYPDA